MRDRYEDSPGETRDASVRRLGRLTWRATQLGTLAAVGFAVVFAHNAPAETTNVQNPPTATPAASATPSLHAVTRAQVTSSPTRKPAVAQLSAPAAQRAAPTTVATTPQLAPPTTPPAPAPTTATPAPTTSSASHGGG